ncbi:MAG: hypothetical protein ACRC0Q_11095 [Kurthia gibsonii]
MLQLNKLIIHGTTYKRTINFVKDLTIISGDKTSGKSLILSLIDYCLGKSKKIDLTVQVELAEKCDQVFLEININNEILTLNRSLKKNTTNLRIYFCEFSKIEEYTPKTLSIKEAMSVLMQKLQVNEYKLIRHKRNSEEKEIETVSFRDIYRYVYIHQHHLGTENFLENVDNFKSRKNKYAFEMMFGLIENDKESLKEQLILIQNKINRIDRELYGLHAYIEDLGEIEKNILHSKVDSITKDIKNLEEKKVIVLRNNDSNSNGHKENMMYIKLKNRINELVDGISEYTTIKRSLSISINSKKMLIKDYKKELQNIIETIDINYKLVIPNQTIECPLCNSNLEKGVHNQLMQNTSSEKMLKVSKKQLENKIKLVDKLIKSEIQKIEDIEGKIILLNENKLILEKAIINYSKETTVPYLSEIEAINSLIHTKITQREKLREGLRIFHKIDEKEKEIETLTKEEKKIQKKIEELNIDEKLKEKIFKYLDQEYRKFMRRFKYEVSEEDTYIHQEKMIPYYKGASVYEHESGGLLECMQLSYLGAILKSKSKGYAEGHPGLLILDSISKYVGTLNKNMESIKVNQKQETKQKITDPEVYNEFYQILIELSKEFQIILVENTPPEKYHEKYSKYTFFTGDRGLVDEEKNEFNENRSFTRYSSFGRL